MDDSAFLKAAVLTKARRHGNLRGAYVIGVAPTSPILRVGDLVAALLGTTQRDLDPGHPEGGELVLMRANHTTRIDHRDGLPPQRLAQSQPNVVPALLDAPSDHGWVPHRDLECPTLKLGVHKRQQ